MGGVKCASVVELGSGVTTICNSENYTEHQNTLTMGFRRIPGDKMVGSLHK